MLDSNTFWIQICTFVSHTLAFVPITQSASLQWEKEVTISVPKVLDTSELLDITEAQAQVTKEEGCNHVTNSCHPPGSDLKGTWYQRKNLPRSERGKMSFQLEYTHHLLSRIVGPPHSLSFTLPLLTPSTPIWTALSSPSWGESSTCTCTEHRAWDEQPSGNPLCLRAGGGRC